MLGVLDLVDQSVPALEVGGRGVDAQLVADQGIQALFVQHAGHFVNGVHVPHGDHAPFSNVGEEGYFLALFLGNFAVGAAQQGVGLDADFAQLLRCVLGGFGFQLARCGDPGHIGQVHKSRIVGAELEAHLAHGFQKRQGLDVAHGAANFNNRHVHRVRRAYARTPAHVILDFVGDVRNDLDGFAQVVAPALFFKHAFVNLAGGEVVGAAHSRGDEALVMAQVQIGLGAIIGDENFAMLERGHGARIHVDVRIELDQSDFEASRLKNRS